MLLFMAVELQIRSSVILFSEVQKLKRVLQEKEGNVCTFQFGILYFSIWDCTTTNVL